LLEAIRIGEKEKIMNRRNNWHRLPNGDLTEDEDLYVSSWTELGKKVEKFFPNYRLYGFDPGVLLLPCDSKQSDSIDLSIRAVMDLIAQDVK
jgi:hypothetical protein